MPTHLTDADVERLNALIARGDAGATGCWKWTGPSSSNSGPVFTARGRRHQVRRLVYELRCGPLPRTGPCFVLPSCRNKACVNPAHLTLSTSPTAAVAPTEHAPPALAPAVLSALETLTALDGPAIGREIAACEARLAALRGLMVMATAGRATLAAAPPAPVRAPAPPKPAPARPPKKSPPKGPAPNKLALRLAHFLAAAGPKPLGPLVGAMNATARAVAHALKGPWFVRDGDRFDVTDAGRTAALEGRP